MANSTKPGTDGPFGKHDRTEKTGFQPLTDEEINEFFDEIDRDGNGYVVFDELEAKLEEVHRQIAPEPSEHHLHHPNRRSLRNGAHRQEIDGEKKTGHNLDDAEKGRAGRSKANDYVDPERDGLHAFLCHIMPGSGVKLDRESFINHVRKWNIPSRSQTSSEDEAKRDAAIEQRMTFARRLRAHWSVEGPQILFMAFVIALQLAFCLWQGIKYVEDPQARAALGWGVIMAKFNAGALYPTLFFVFLSMSRWFSTFMRRFYWVSRFINWDHHQAFHIIMSCEAYVFATLHAIGHLTGTFLYGSRPAQQDNLALIVGANAVPKSYGDFVSTIPGWSGVTAFALFTIIAFSSMPMVRKWDYEIFQLNHLLMYPFAAMLCAHGTASILQKPALGYVLAFPLALVLLERLHRLYRGFVNVPARMEILDDNTVAITCKHPRGKNWRYQAGQYIFLQVPKVSFFQWHPFTISECRDELLRLHIKCENKGWTQKLRDLLPQGEDIRVGIDGPFGAPAQRFYNFDRSIIMGSGIGVTPFSAILADLEQNLSGNKENPWRSGRTSRRASLALSTRSRLSSRSRQASRSRPTSRAPSTAPQENVVPPSAKLDNVDVSYQQGNEKPTAEGLRNVMFAQTRRPSKTTSLRSDLSRKMTDSVANEQRKPARRVDFVWSVRERNDLLWFSSLLNRVHDLSFSLAPQLQVNIEPYITAKRKGISTHVFRYLLDRYRTPSSPVSALTGLKMEANFGRPDLEGMIEDYHKDMLKEGFSGKVGIFFCGSPVIGRILSDTCREMTTRARADGSGIRYVFMMEVFG